MLKKLISFINSNQLFSHTDRVLIATSGGLDSVVLCHLLSLAKYDIAIAHCNFQLRGDESDKDESFTIQLAAMLNIPIYTKKFDTREYSKSNKVSIQIAARNLRYEWFKNLKNIHQYDYIATAHHASDQTETVLYNLSKGCGISGLRGIPLRNNNIVRPLLFASKDDILDYAKENNLRWREDASNQENKYSRNLIRNKIIPQLKNINEGIDDTMIRNVERYKSIETYIDSEVNKVKSQYLSKEGDDWKLNLSWLTDDNKVLLQHILSDFEFNYFQTKDIILSVENSGTVFYNDAYQLSIDREQIFIKPIASNSESNLAMEINEGESEFTIGTDKYEMRIHTKIEFSPSHSIACLDYDKISFPIEVRNWIEGDKFIPLGMKSKKKLSDFMIDEKIPVNLKKQVPVFVSNGDIFWVAGYRIDDRFKISDNTKRVLMIVTNPNNVKSI